MAEETKVEIGFGIGQVVSVKLDEKSSPSSASRSRPARAGTT